MIKRFFQDESGATAIEYGLICGLIFLVIVAAIAPIGDYVKGAFEQAEAGFEQGES